jgi:glycosyltransferase involved in cell wall biosynthesis
MAEIFMSPMWSAKRAFYILRLVEVTALKYERLLKMANQLPSVSVIVPTFRDWESLEKTIRAIQKQTYSTRLFEVILVNNDAENMHAEMALPDNFMLVNESKPGSYAARNRGIDLARGDVLAFTDSDCLPEPDWLENAVRHLTNGAQRLAGRVRLYYRGSRLNWVEKYEKAYAFPQRRYADEGVSVTANMIVWRYCFDRVGKFNDALFSGGDTEWGRRALEANIPIRYAPDVVVLHPARARMIDLLTKRRRLAAAALKINKPRNSLALFMSLFRGVMPPTKHFRRLYRRTDLTLNEKACALALVYLFKIYGTWQRVLLLLGRHPERR